MATTVQNFVGGGTNLTKLTSGELLLIFLLDGKWTWNTGHSFDYYIQGLNHDNPNANRTGFRVDLSKISAMAFQVLQLQNTNIWANVENFSWSSVSNNNLYNITSYMSGSYIIRCTSFTTTDGKVHTADNLNY